MWKVDDLRGQTAYLDTNIFINAFEARDPVLQRALDGLFADIDTGITRACTSLITRVEVLVRPLREGQTGLVRTYREVLSGAFDIVVLPVAVDIIDCAAQLRAARRGLRLPDAIHLATAMLCSCRYFVTSDKRLTGRFSGVEVLQLHRLMGD